MNEYSMCGGKSPGRQFRNHDAAGSIFWWQGEMNPPSSFLLSRSKCLRLQSLPSDLWPPATSLLGMIYFSSGFATSKMKKKGEKNVVGGASFTETVDRRNKRGRCRDGKNSGNSQHTYWTAESKHRLRFHQPQQRKGTSRRKSSFEDECLIFQ